MKKSIFTLILLLGCAALFAQNEVELVGEVEFDTAIINDEFEPSKDALQPSSTTAGARFSPRIGFSFGRGNRIMLGADVARLFGTPEPVFGEISLWYQKNMTLKSGTEFTLGAGIIPYSKAIGDYTTLIFSDQANFLDFNFDGFMFQLSKDDNVFEFLFDWNGLKSETVHEEFYFVSYGLLYLAPVVALGYQGSFHHYSSSLEVHGTVDDHILNPFVLLDFSSLTGLQALSLNIGGIAGYQRDRVAGIRKYPLGADVRLEVSNWNLGILNEAYYGQSQAPFYNSLDPEDEPYEDRLYFRSPIWQISPDAHHGFYDRLEVYWAPHLADWVDVRLKVVAHFASSIKGGFAGTQQIGEIRVNLENIFARRCHRHANPHTTPHE